jgi:hypothetical protein
MVAPAVGFGGLVSGILALLLVCACSGPGERELFRGKPQAPVAAWIATRDLGGGVHEVTLIGVPSRAVSSLELELRVPSGAVALGPTRVDHGAVAAGAPRSLVVPVRLGVSGVDVAGAARVPMPSGQRRMRPALARLGAPAPAAARKPIREVVLPSGDRVAEVRP